MRNYIRNYVPGGTYFFTVVAYDRRAFLTTEPARRCLRQAIRETRARWPFSIVAIVLLPDHWHTVMSLPDRDADFSLRMRKIKEGFTKAYLNAAANASVAAFVRPERGQRAVWQPRFWEHTVRDEAELKQCVDYVHWNPAKHRLVRRVADYPWSSFQRYVKMGEYAGDWGAYDPCPDFEMPE
ncbi:MAG: transposase [Planctomycetota bacterium]|nr:transposase [Planctomycetota bacterium]